MQPNEGQSHLQLVVPTEIREKIVRDINEGVTWVEIRHLAILKNGFIGLVITMT